MADSELSFFSFCRLEQRGQFEGHVRKKHSKKGRGKVKEEQRRGHEESRKHPNSKRDQKRGKKSIWEQLERGGPKQQCEVIEKYV